MNKFKPGDKVQHKYRGDLLIVSGYVNEETVELISISSNGLNLVVFYKEDNLEFTDNKEKSFLNSFKKYFLNV